MSSYAMQASVIINGFAVMFLINRYLGIAMYGVYVIILAIVNTLSNIVTMRGIEVIPKFYVREYDRQNYQLAKMTLIMGSLIDILSALILLACVYGVAGLLSHYFIKDEDCSGLIILYSFVAVIGYLKNTISGYFLAIKNIKFYNNLIIFENILKISAIIVCIAWLNITLENLAYSFLAATAISILINVYYFMRFLDKKVLSATIKTNMKFIKEYLYFNINTFASSLLKAGHQNIDSLILSYFVNPAAVGLYQTIKKFFVPMQFIATPFATLNYSRYLLMYERKEYQNIKRDVVSITKHILIVSFAYGTLVLSLLPWLSSAMNISYDFDITINAFLIFIYVLLLNFGWWNRMISLVANPSLSLWVTIYLNFMTLGVCMLGAHLYQLNGLLIGYIVIFISIQAFYMFYFRRKL